MVASDRPLRPQGSKHLGLARTLRRSVDRVRGQESITAAMRTVSCARAWSKRPDPRRHGQPRDRRFAQHQPRGGDPLRVLRTVTVKDLANASPLEARPSLMPASWLFKREGRNDLHLPPAPFAMAGPVRSIPTTGCFPRSPKGASRSGFSAASPGSRRRSPGRGCPGRGPLPLPLARSPGPPRLRSRSIGGR
jgi:hypothetical protein